MGGGGGAGSSFSAGVSTQGNTLGTTGTNAAGLVLVGGTNVTLSQSSAVGGATVSIIAGGAGVIATDVKSVGGLSSVGTVTRYSPEDHIHVGVAGIVPIGTASTFVGNVVISQGNLMSLASGGNLTAGSIQIINRLSSSDLAARVSNVSSAGSQTLNFALVDHAHVGVAGIVPNATASSFVGYMNLSAGNNISLASGGNSSAGSIQIINILTSGNFAAPVSNVSSAGTQTASFALPDHAHVGVAGIHPTGTASTFVGTVHLSAGSNISLASGGNATAGTLTIAALGGGTGFTTASTVNGPFSGTLGTNGLSFKMPFMSRFMVPDAQHMTQISAPGQGSASIQYIANQGFVTGSRIDGLVAWSGSSSASAVTMAIAISAWAAIYTRNVSTLSSVSSGSTQTTYSYASNTAGQTQFTNSQIRPISVPVNFNMQPGEYFCAFNFSTAASSIGAATTNLGQTLSMVGGNDFQTAINYNEITNNTAASTNLYGGMGVYTAQTAGLPANISLSAIAQTGASLSQANIALVFRNA